MLVKKNIFVTGASGFVGRYVIAELLKKSEEFNIFALVRKSTFSSDAINEIIVDDIYDLHWLVCFDQPIDTIIHIAGLAHNKFNKNDNKIDLFKKINSIATKNIALKSAEKNTRRFIFISSIGVLGNVTHSIPFSEDSAISPAAEYAVSKHEAENEIIKICENFPMEFVIVRPPLVYGFDAPGNFSTLLKVIEKGIPLPFLSIKNSKSFIGCQNLANFICYCIKHPKAGNQIFLPADNKNISTPNLIEILSRAMNSKTILFSFPVPLIKFFCYILKRKNLYQQLCCSLEIRSSKIKDLLGWNQPYETEKSIESAGIEFLKSKRDL